MRSGGGHRRRDASLREAQHAGEGRQGASLVDQESLPHRHDGRPGPVLVDIPKDVTTQSCEFDYPESVSMRSYNPVRKGHAGQIKKAAQLLLEAERPMSTTGGGVILSDAAAVTRAGEAARLPCTNTLMGLGAYPATDKQFLGMPGMHGTYEANMSMQHCDVLLAIGARFDDRVIGNPAHFAQNPRKIIHIDIDPSSISKRVKVDVPIVGNIPDVLDELLRLLRDSKPRHEAVVEADRTSGGEGLPQVRPQLEDHQAAVRARKLYEVTKGEAFVTSDVGQHQMWAAQFYKFDQPRAGSTPAASARWASACRGDGRAARESWIHGGLRHRRVSIQMCLQELSTASSTGCRSRSSTEQQVMGMVRQWQQFFHGNRYSESYMDALPDFVKPRRGLRPQRPAGRQAADVEPALREAFARKNELVFLDFITDQKENVYPMIPGGKGSPR